MRISKLLAAAMLCGLAQIALADDAIRNAQIALKGQGFYYGAITGETSTDTTAAIRRFQIRNGLQVTGQLNEETQRALGNANPGTPAPTAPPQTAPRPLATAPPAPLAPPVPAGPNDEPPVNSEIYQPRAVAPDIFSNTPYANALPEVQQRVVRGAQAQLRRRGYYRAAVDGVYGPALAFSLRAYQSQIGIPPSGRFDMDTLASMHLLPGQQVPPLWRRVLPYSQVPVRGEWIH